LKHLFPKAPLAANSTSPKPFTAFIFLTFGRQISRSRRKSYFAVIAVGVILGTMHKKQKSVQVFLANLFSFQNV